MAVILSSSKAEMLTCSISRRTSPEEPGLLGGSLFGRRLGSPEVAGRFRLWPSALPASSAFSVASSGLGRRTGCSPAVCLRE